MQSLGTAVVEETKTQTWSGIFFRVYILLTTIYLTHVMPCGLSQKSFNNVILSKWKLLPSILPFPIFQALEVIPICYFFWYHNRSTCSVIHLSVTFPSISSGEPSYYQFQKQPLVPHHYQDPWLLVICYLSQPGSNSVGSSFPLIQPSEKTYFRVPEGDFQLVKQNLSDNVLSFLTFQFLSSFIEI